MYAFAPELSRPEDYDSAGRVRLPEEYRAWVESNQNTLGDLLEGSGLLKHLRILEPRQRRSLLFRSGSARTRSAGCVAG
jgi:hypothetical protein